MAAQQGEVENQIDEVRRKVDEQDQQIKNLQKQLKDAESLLSNTIYQANHKFITKQEIISRNLQRDNIINLGLKKKL